MRFAMHAPTKSGFRPTRSDIRAHQGMTNAVRSRLAVVDHVAAAPDMMCCLSKYVDM
jgi:hypothetical protein